MLPLKTGLSQPEHGQTACLHVSAFFSTQVAGFPSKLPALSTPVHTAPPPGTADGTTSQSWALTFPGCAAEVLCSALYISSVKGD